MADTSRRAMLTALGLAPFAGGLAAWSSTGEPKAATTPRVWKDRDPREHMRDRYFPNVELVTHAGKKVRFYDDLVKDRKVVFNMIYVACEKICIPTTMNLVTVQRMLEERNARDIHFYTFTLTPEEDTPEVLAEYAKTHGAGGRWTFLTGTTKNIDTVRRKLGFTYPDPEEDADKSNHVGMLRFGNEPEMRWGACPGQANPEHIVRTMLWDLA